MIKVLLCILLNIVFTSVGIKLSHSLKRREKLFFDFVSFCNSFKANLDYFRKDLSDFTKEFCETSSNEFCEFASKKMFGAEVDISWIESKFDLMTQEQMEYANAFFDILGKGDATSQKSQIAAYQAYFEQQYENAKMLYAKKGKMYTKLGTLTGIFLSILII